MIGNLLTAFLVSTFSSSPSDHSTPTSSNTSTPTPSPSHGLNAGTIAAIVIGAAATFLLMAGSIFYLFKRRRTRTTQHDRIIIHEKDAAPVNFRALPEMVETGQVQELGGPDHVTSELEHRALPVELQASRSYHQDESRS